jgi:thymidylate kinase
MHDPAKGGGAPEGASPPAPHRDIAESLGAKLRRLGDCLAEGGVQLQRSRALHEPDASTSHSCVISISGVDGSGKTTLAHALHRALPDSRVVKYRTTERSEVSLTLKQAASSHDDDRDHETSIAQLLAADQVSYYWARLLAAPPASFTICDRYVYDHIITASTAFDVRPRSLVGIYALAPAPCFSVGLRADLATASRRLDARDGRSPLETGSILEAKVAAYEEAGSQAVFDLIPEPSQSCEVTARVIKSALRGGHG